MPLSAYSALMPLYPLMLYLCRRSPEKVWSNKGSMACCQKNISLPSLGRKRLRSRTVMATKNQQQKRMKKAIFLLSILLTLGCNPHSRKEVNILHPDFHLTAKKLLKDGFYEMPEDVPILGKQLEDTLLYYQFDENMTLNSSPVYMLCEFPVKSVNRDSIENFLWERNYQRICEYESDDSFEIFYIKHHLKNYIYYCSIDIKNYKLFLSYSYPQIDD